MFNLDIPHKITCTFVCATRQEEIQVLENNGICMHSLVLISLPSNTKFHFTSFATREF